VIEARWVGSKLNRGIWAITLLSKKSCALTTGYSFWPGDKALDPNNWY